MRRIRADQAFCSALLTAALDPTYADIDPTREDDNQTREDVDPTRGDAEVGRLKPRSGGADIEMQVRFEQRK